MDWDMGQRRGQKSAFLMMRRLSRALEAFRRTNGAYPARIAPLHDFFIEAAISEDQYEDRDYAEFQWRKVVDADHASGYLYEYRPSDPMASKPVLFTHYALHADPVERGRTGFRSFYVDDNGSIRWNGERQATATDPIPDVDPILDVHSFWTEGPRPW